MSGRICEEVRPHIVAAFFLSEFGKVFLQFPFKVSPSEIGVTPVEPDFGEALHDLGTREAFGEEDNFGMPGADLPDHPLPEGERLGVEVVDPEDLYPVADPKQYDVAQSVPETWEASLWKVHIDDVLALLGRILGEFEGAVRPPVEPFRMHLNPGLVWRTLNRKVDRDLQPVPPRSSHQAMEILEAPQLRLDGIVPSMF
jgi:hypothetical protein